MSLDQSLPISYLLRDIIRLAKSLKCLCLVYVYVIQNVKGKVLKKTGTSNSCCYYYSHFVDIESQAARV